MKKLFSLAIFFAVPLAYAATPITGYVQVYPPLSPQAGYFNISSGTVGQFTITGLPAGQCVSVGAGGILITVPCGSGGGGVAGQIVASNQYSVPYYFVAGSSNVLSGLSPGTSGQILITGGSTGPPFWSNHLPTGASNYIQNTSSLQSGATFYVSSGTISGNFYNSSLTSGQCVQTATGGLLTVTGSPCGSGGGSLPLPAGATNYIQNSSSLQAGATAYPSFVIAGSTFSPQGSGPLGTGSAIVGANVTLDTTNANGGLSGIKGLAYTSPTVPSVESIFGVQGSALWSGSADNSSGGLVAGIFAQGDYSGSGKLSGVAGEYVAPVDFGTGTVGNSLPAAVNALSGIVGLMVTPGNTGGGLAYQQSGLTINNTTINHSTTTNNYGVRIFNPTTDATAVTTNNYALYVDSQTAGSNNFGIYQVPNGGQNQLSTTTLVGTLIASGSAGSGGQVLQSQGASASPTWATISSGGSSALQVTLSGVQVTSPTASINLYTGDFIGNSVGTTAQIALNPATTNYIRNTSALQSGSVFYVSSGTVNGNFSLTGTNENVLYIPGTGTGGTSYLWAQGSSSVSPSKFGLVYSSLANGTTNLQLLFDPTNGFLFQDGSGVSQATMTSTGNFSTKVLNVSSTTNLSGDLRISSGILLSSSYGTNGQVLTSGGANTIPTWTTVSGGSGLTTLNTSTGPVVTLTTPQSSLVIGSPVYGVGVSSLSLDVNTTYLNGLYAQLAASNVYSNGTRQTTGLSATTAGLRLTGGTLPSAQLGGDLLLNASGIMGVNDGANADAVVTLLGSGSSYGTAPTANDVMVWGPGYRGVDSSAMNITASSVSVLGTGGQVVKYGITAGSVTISSLSNTVLAVNSSGTIISTTVAGGTVPGSDTQVIYDSAGIFGADAGMTYAYAGNVKTLALSAGTNQNGTGQLQVKDNSGNLYFQVSGAAQSANLVQAQGGYYAYASPGLNGVSAPTILMADGSSGTIYRNTFMTRWSPSTRGDLGDQDTGIGRNAVATLEVNNGTLGSYGGIIASTMALVNTSTNSVYILTLATSSTANYRMSVATSGAVAFAGSYGTNGQVLTTAGSGSGPTWTTVSGSGASLSSTNTWTAGQTFTSSTTFTGAVVVSSGIVISSHTLASNQPLGSLMVNPSGRLGFNDGSGAQIIVTVNSNTTNYFTPPTSGDYVTWTNNYGLLDTGSNVIPVNGGGTGTGSTLTGFVRGSAFTMTGTELSGDATTSGSGAVTLAALQSHVTTFSSSETFNGTVAISSGLTLNGSAGTTGQFLTSGGTNTKPFWTTPAGGSVSNYYTSGAFTGIGPTSFTPSVGTLMVIDTTPSTGVTDFIIKNGPGQGASNFLEMFDFAGNKELTANDNGGIPIFGIYEGYLNHFSAGGLPIMSSHENSGTYYDILNNVSVHCWGSSGRTDVGNIDTCLGRGANGSLSVFNNQTESGGDSAYSGIIASTLTLVNPSTASVYSVKVGTSSVGYQIAITTTGHLSSFNVGTSTSSCGTGAGFSGTDFAGTITPGSVASGCTVTFAKPFTNTPACIVTEQTLSLVNPLTYTPSTTALTISQTSLTSKLNYICTGVNE